MSQESDKARLQDPNDQPIVLVIHQSEAVLESCTRLLEKHGYTVETAVDGSEGIRAAYRIVPDAIVAGGATPELNGYQVCRLLKNDPVMRKIPLLLLVDVARKMERFWGMKAGVDDFIGLDELEANLLRRVRMVLDIYDQLDVAEKQALKQHNENNPFNIRARINQILDISLIESMLMVEFRSMSDLIHDPGLLNYMLFSLLESILEYSAAAVLYQDEGKGPRLVTFHLPDGKSQTPAYIEKLSENFFRHLLGHGMAPSQLEITTTDVIGVLDDAIEPVNYVTTYTREFYVESTLIGAIAIYSDQPVDFSRIFPLHLIEDEIRLLMKLRHLYSRAETLAVTDVLTGLFNQKHFMSQIQHEFKTARRYEQDLSLAFIGVDEFKQINELYGHAAGDEMLRLIAEMMEKSFRSVDIMARFGGRYLAVLLPSTPRDAAELALQRFLDKVSGTEFVWDGKVLTVTISIGLCDLQCQAASAAELMNKAEVALHEARRLGGNRIEISPA